MAALDDVGAKPLACLLHRVGKWRSVADPAIVSQEEILGRAIEISSKKQGEIAVAKPQQNRVAVLGLARSLSERSNRVAEPTESRRVVSVRLYDRPKDLDRKFRTRIRIKARHPASTILFTAMPRRKHLDRAHAAPVSAVWTSFGYSFLPRTSASA